MEYKGFEVFASEIPAGLVPEERAPVGGGKVFACEVFAAEDVGQANVLAVFDLAVGRDIVDDSDETVIVALKRYVDEHYGELMAEVVRHEPYNKMPNGISPNIDRKKITETANAQLCFDNFDGRHVVCVDFVYDNHDDLQLCDVENVLTLPATEVNVKWAQEVLRQIHKEYGVPVYDGSADVCLATVLENAQERASSAAVEEVDLRKVYVLVCTHETQYGSESYVFLKPSRQAAEEYVETVKANENVGTFGDDEWFDYRIEEQVLNVKGLEMAQFQKESELV